MTNAQDLVTSAQRQALEAIRSGQEAALDAIRSWHETAAKFRPEVPAGLQVPGVKESLGEPKAIVDSVYDFTGQLLELNKEFVHSVLEASSNTTEGDGAGSATAKKATAKK